MAQTWKTVRIFISSTFRDMQSERDYLVRFVFPELRERCAKQRLHLVDVDLRWGVTEKEAEEGKALEVCLDEIERCHPFFVGLLGERYGWVPPRYEVPELPSYDWVRDFPQGHSITAMEIYHGVLRNPTMHSRARFYFRDPAFISDVPTQYKARFLSDNEESKAKLDRLKDDIRAQCLVRENYPCGYGGIDADGNVLLTSLEVFGQQVLEDLWAAIQEEYPADEKPADELEIERSYHETFIEGRSRRFIGRRDLIAQMSGYADGDEATPLVVTGAPGCGKSALLARFVIEYSALHPELYVLTHFIGVSPRSTDARRTLLRLCRELKQKFAIEEDIPTDYYELVQTFVKFLEQAAKPGKVLLVIDALNQLDEGHYAHDLDWLPMALPTGLKLIVSTLEGVCLDALQRRHPAPREVLVGPLGDDERKEIVRQTLEAHRKALDENQLGLLLNKKESNYPLFLIVACEELRVFGEFERVTQRIESLPGQVEPLFEQVLERVEHDHGKELATDAVVLLECSRHGLLESELLELLVRDGAAQLPHGIWARCYRSLQFYLRPPGEYADGLLDFFHPQLAKAVRQRYLKDAETEIAAHQRLAVYFQHKADPSESGLWDANYPRGLSELAYHLLEGKMYDALFKTASDETFLQAQANAFVADPSIQLDTLQKALTGAAQIDDAAKMAEFMLRHAQRLKQIAEISPLDALREGRLEQALNLANLIFSTDKKRGVLWLLLLGWYLKRQGRNEDARKILADLAARDLPRSANSDLAALALCQLQEIDETSFLMVQEEFLDSDGQLTLCQNLLARHDNHAVNSEDERIINLTFHIAQKVSIGDIRAKALIEIARVQAAAGKDEEAKRAIQEIEDESNRAKALSGIAQAQVMAGRNKEALKTVREIEDEGSRARALSEIAQLQARAGHVSEALETLSEMSNATRYSKARAKALGKIADAQVAAGMFEEALKTAREIEVESNREEALSGIAQAQVEAGRVEEAIKTTRGITDELGDWRTEALSKIAQAQARRGEIDQAIKTARELSYESNRAKALGKIAEAQVEAERIEEAFKTAKELEDDGCRIEVLINIVQAQLGVGRFEEAEKTIEESIKITREIQKEGWRVHPLTRIAKAQVAVGRLEEAQMTFEEAVKAARRIEHEFSRENALSSIAGVLVEMVQAQGARGSDGEARKMATKGEDWEAILLRKIVEAQVAVGKLEEAFKTTREMVGKCETWRVKALSKIAQAQTDAGRDEVAIQAFEEAVMTAPIMRTAESRTYVLLEIGKVQVVTGRTEEAEKTFEAAIKMAGEMMVSHQGEVLRKIAEAQVTAGKVEEARTTFVEAVKRTQAIYDESSRRSFLAEILKAATGKVKDTEKIFEEALKIARNIKADEDDSRTTALMDIAEWQVAAGKPEQAAETCEEALNMTKDIFGSYGRKKALGMIAEMQIKIGKVEEAWKTVEEILEIERRFKDENWRNLRLHGLEWLARVQAGTGRNQEALETVRAIEDEGSRTNALRRIALTQLAAGKVEEALKTAREIKNGYWRTEVLIDIGRVQVADGATEDATETFEEAMNTAIAESDGFNRSSVLSKIARAQVKAGRVEEALKTVRELPNGYADFRVEVLSKMAKTQAAMGKIEEAEKTIEEAVEATKEIQDERWRVGPLTEIAQAQIVAGKSEAAQKTFEEAIKTAVARRNESDRARALMQIARAQAVAGKVEEVMKTIKLILVRGEDAVSQVAEVFVSKCEKDGFKQLLAHASYNISASYKMCGLLALLYSDDEDAIHKIAALIIS